MIFFPVIGIITCLILGIYGTITLFFIALFAIDNHNPKNRKA